MALASREKGKVGEREAAKCLSKFLGIPITRTQQYSGAAGDADLTGLKGVHIEVKRRNRTRVNEWMEATLEDKKHSDVPLIVHRIDGGQWLATLPVKYLYPLAKCITYAKDGPD